MKLVIVESPAKARTIVRYLGNEFSVIASRGHICDLATDGVDGLGIEINNNFSPHYIINSDKVKTVDYLKSMVEKSDEVYLASDPDREGEAISWHLARVLNLDVATTKRLEFQEITPFGIKSALENVGIIDMPLVWSQETRRIMDRIIGFKLSKLLREKIHSLSAGRVQSVVLKLIVDRQNEIDNFVPKEYWNISVEAKKESRKATFSLTKVDEVDAKVENEQQKDSILERIPSTLIVQQVIKEEKKHFAYPALTTSSLQQEMFTKHKYPTAKTMKIAQKLYEGVKIDKGHVGLITYMRTDSTRLSPLFVSVGRKYITEKYGEEYIGFAPTKSKSKNNVQDAHEAIRPTHLNYHPDDLKKELSAEEYNVYKVIYERAVAALMAPRISDDCKIIASNNGLEFEANSSVTTFKGFTILLETKVKDVKSTLNVEQNDILEVVDIESKQNFTKPPLPYSEARLVKQMEECGIGRPSTYSSTIETLKKRSYVISRAGILTPSEQGVLTNNKLQEFFSEIVNVKYTASMEEELDEIAANNLTKDGTLAKFYTDFIKIYEKAYKEMEVEPLKHTGEMCSKCGNPLIFRKGRFGDFIGCSNYPVCTFIKPLIPDNAKTCPTCNQGKLIVKKGSKGAFLACSDYPKCTYTEPFKKFTKDKD